MGKDLKTFDGGHKLTRRDIQFLQDAASFPPIEIIKALLPVGVNKCILSGFDVTKTGSDYNWTNGVIYSDDEVYAIDASTSPLTEASIPKLAISESELYSVQYASGVEKFVHIERKLVLVPASDPEGLFELTSLFKLNRLIHQHSAAIGTIVSVKIPTADIPSHFDGTGLGISDWWTGWKIDADSAGRVIVGYKESDTDFNASNGSKIGGLKEVTLTINQIPPHNHANGAYDRVLKQDGFDTVAGADNSSGEPNLKSSQILSTQGGGMPHTNMMPYVVYLNVEKL